MARYLKTPLRYPGGKSRAVDLILSCIPNNVKEFREPFVGGGSIFLARKSINNKSKYYINDINYGLYSLWECIKSRNEELVKIIYEIKEMCRNGRELFKFYRENKDGDILYKAVRFFILNRISFSGLIESGGYSQKAFEERFTISSINKLVSLKKIMQDVTIYSYDYKELLDSKGEDVFMFLDPPYLSAKKSKLYGHNGNLHTSFNHKEFADNMKNCKHKWLITLDDCEEIRKYFSFANISEYTLQYGMNNYKKTISVKGKELLISNYDINNKLCEYEEESIFDIPIY